jgi:HD superfamily phosphodiesterase
MTPRPEPEGWLAEIFSRALPYLDTRNNEIHARISYYFALRLIEGEGGDPEVILPAILIHDVGWKSVPEEDHLKAFGPGDYDVKLNRIHEVEGAATAGRILADMGYDPARTAEIVEIISGHDSRLEPLSLNDAIVKDADKLWRFSEEALDIDPKRFKLDPAYHAAWLKHRIDEWMLTKTGKKLAAEEQSRRAEFFGPPK